MKAKEIRNEELHNMFSSSGEPRVEPRDSAYFLREIAAQLADLNERLDGFMGSMVKLSVAVAELNTELRNSAKGKGV